MPYIKIVFFLVYVNSFNRAFRLGDPIPKPLTEDEKIEETMWKVFEIQAKKKLHLDKEQLKQIKANFMENLGISQEELNLLKKVRKEQPHFFLDRMKEYFTLTDKEVAHIDKNDIAKAKTIITQQPENMPSLTEVTTSIINIKLIKPDKLDDTIDNVTIKIDEKLLFNEPIVIEKYNNESQGDKSVIIARKNKQITFNDCTETFGKLLQYFDKLGLTLKEVLESQRYSKFKNDRNDEVNKYNVNNSDEIYDDINQLANRRVYHGLKTHIENFPFMASISCDGIFRCGGSIVSGHIIITAASCLNLKYAESQRSLDALTVRVGSDYLYGGEEMKVEQVFIHPKYDDKTKQNNLALLKFTKKPPHKNNIAIITINRNLQPDLNSITILGWGPRYNKVREKIEPMRSHFSKGQLQLMDLEKCRTAFISSKSKIKEEEHFCATSELHGSGACKYDVGIPGVAGAQLVGVVSLIYPDCTRPGAPTVFTRVAPYIDWIDSVILRFNQTQENISSNRRNKKIYYPEVKHKKPGFDLRLPDSKGKHEKTYTKVIKHNSKNNKYKKITQKRTKNPVDKNGLTYKTRGYIVYNSAHHKGDRFHNEVKGKHFQTTIQEYTNVDVTARRLKSLIKNKEIRRKNNKIYDEFGMKIDNKILAPALKTTYNIIHELDEFADENDEYIQIRYNKQKHTTASLKKHKTTKSWREENYPEQENWNTRFQDKKIVVQIPNIEWKKTFGYAGEMEATSKGPDFESATVIQEPEY